MPPAAGYPLHDDEPRALRAERRWVMSGTPPRRPARRPRLLYGILAFVRYPLGASAKAWQQVAAPILRSADTAAAALEAVLSELLVRHEKSATRIPPLLRRTVRLRCSAAERLAYNTVVGFARANVLLTAMEGAEKSDGWEMSLLNPENHKERSSSSQNIGWPATAAAASAPRSRATPASGATACGTITRPYCCSRSPQIRRGGDRARRCVHAAADASLAAGRGGPVRQVRDPAPVGW